MTATPAHEFLIPRIDALIAEAGTHGIDRDTAIAVLLDILGGEIGEPPPASGSNAGSEPSA